MGLSGYGARKAVCLSLSSYLPLDEIIQNSVEIMRLLDRHTRIEIKITTQRKRLFDRHTRPEAEITTGIDEGRNPPMPAVPEG